MKLLALALALLVPACEGTPIEAPDPNCPTTVYARTGDSFCGRRDGIPCIVNNCAAVEDPSVVITDGCATTSEPRYPSRPGDAVIGPVLCFSSVELCEQLCGLHQQR